MAISAIHNNNNKHLALSVSIVRTLTMSYHHMIIAVSVHYLHIIHAYKCANTSSLHIQVYKYKPVSGCESSFIFLHKEKFIHYYL